MRSCFIISLILYLAIVVLQAHYIAKHWCLLAPRKIYLHVHLISRPILICDEMDYNIKQKFSQINSNRLTYLEKLVAENPVLVLQIQQIQFYILEFAQQ